MSLRSSSISMAALAVCWASALFSPVSPTVVPVMYTVTTADMTIPRMAIVTRSSVSVNPR